MTDLTRLEFNGKKGRLLFRGSCLEVLPLCEGVCCRIDWAISITLDEYESGLYEVDVICSLTGKECEKDVDTCIDRSYRLKRKEDGSCVYLDSNNKCNIYENRPRVCRDFSCKGGWRLVSVFPVDDKSKSPGAKMEMEKEDFIERLRDDMTFVLHPLLKLHTVFCLKAKGEIIFVKEMVGQCGKFNTRDSFDNPKLDDDKLLGLINLFSRKDTLQETRQRFCSQYDVDLTKTEFYETVWLLNKHSIILSSRNFPGMLGGVGRI